jgi:hypothetical protein
VSDLKEDAPVDIHNAITPTHLLLWALLTLLLTWTITFAYLAIRRKPEVTTTLKETTTPMSAMSTRSTRSTMSIPKSTQPFKVTVPIQASAMQQKNLKEEVVLEKSLS